MMRKERRKRASICLAAVVVLTCHLVQTIDCLRLKKTEKQSSQADAAAAHPAGVQEGQIVFGDVLHEDSRIADGTGKASSNATEDETTYQADFTGWSNVKQDDGSSKDTWNHLGTSLHCLGDHMKFRYLGPEASHLTVQQDDKSQLPVSMVPPKCGYNMHGNSLVFVMTVPYDGCHVVQQGGKYVLPMQWHGNPVSLLCPKHATADEPKKHHWYHGPHKHHWHPKPHKDHWHHEPHKDHWHHEPHKDHWHHEPQKHHWHPKPHKHHWRPKPLSHLWHPKPQKHHWHPKLQKHHWHHEPHKYHWHHNPLAHMWEHWQRLHHKPQDAQVQVVPHVHQDAQLLIAPRVIRDDQVQVVQQTTAQDAQVQVVPQATQEAPVEVAQPAPQDPQTQMPPVHYMPQANFFSYPSFSHSYSTATDHATNLPEFPNYPPYAQLSFPFLPPPPATTAEPPAATVQTGVTFRDIPFHSPFAWSYGPRYPIVMPVHPYDVPELQYPWSPVLETKPTMPPSAVAQASDARLPFYPPEHMPYLSYEHLYFPHMPHKG